MKKFLLSWQPPTGSVVTDYIIEYGLHNQEWKTYYDGLNSNTISYITGLNDCSIYRFRVAATNSIGTGAYSNIVSGMSLGTAPSEPLNLIAVTGDRKFNLSWDSPLDNGGCSINEYIIEYTQNNNSPSYLNTHGTDNHYILFNLINNNPYSIRVAAVNNIGIGSYSQPTTGLPGKVPSQPTGLILTYANRNLYLSWFIPEDVGPGIIDYIIQYSIDNESTWTTYNDDISVTPSATLTGLALENHYFTRVAAVNIFGSGSYSIPSNSVFLIAIPLITIITQPSNQTAFNAQATFVVSASVTENAVLSYQWQKQDVGSGSFFDIIGETNSSLFLSNLNNIEDNGDLYRCVVSATDGAVAINSDSATLIVNTPIITITSQPSNQIANGGSATFLVTATVTEGATLSYQWQKQESGSGPFSNIDGATSNSLLLSNLNDIDDNGDVYRCVLSANGGAADVTSSSAVLRVPSDTLLLLRANSNWGPTDEGPNNYYFYSLDPYEASNAGNELALTTLDSYAAWSPMYVERIMSAGNSGVFSTSPLMSDTFTTYTALRSSDATDLLSQMANDFTIELWLARDSTDNRAAIDNSLLTYYNSETYLRIGRIFLGTAMSYVLEYNNYTTIPQGARTFVSDGDAYAWDNPIPFYDPDTGEYIGDEYDISRYPSIITTSKNQDIYNGTFPNSMNVPGNAANYVHIAIVRDTNGSTYSDELRFYMDGTLIGTADLTSNGWNWENESISSQSWLNGVSFYGFLDTYSMNNPRMYYDDIRISSSVKYTGNTITVPSTSLPGARSSATPHTELLLHCDSGPADYGSNMYYLSALNSYTTHWHFIRPSVTLDTATKKFGAASYSFNAASNQYGILDGGYSFTYGYGAGSAIIDLLNKLELAQEYTIEMWIRPTGTMGANGEVYLTIGPGYDWLNKNHLVLMDSINGPFDGQYNNYYENYYTSGLRLVWVDSLYVGNTENRGRVQYSISTSSLARNVWSHVAIVYNNGEWRLKVNGTDSGDAIAANSLTDTVTPFTSNIQEYYSDNIIVLGATLDPNNYSQQQLPTMPFNGNIDEIRFSSVDRYGSGSYTVPTEAFN